MVFLFLLQLAQFMKEAKYKVILDVSLILKPSKSLRLSTIYKEEPMKKIYLVVTLLSIFGFLLSAVLLLPKLPLISWLKSLPGVPWSSRPIQLTHPNLSWWKVGHAPPSQSAHLINILHQN